MLHRKEDWEPEASASLVRGGYPTLLSPPYSPRHRPLLQLCEEDESNEADSLASTSGTLLQLVHFARMVRSDGINKGRVEPSDADPLRPTDPFDAQRKTFDLINSDSWDEALFLNAPSATDPSGSLNLSLFGPSRAYIEEDEPPMSASPSPRMRTQGLPSLDEGGDYARKVTCRPLFTPSDFDVFENDWDTIPSGSSQSTSPMSSSAPETICSPLSDRYQPFDIHMQETLPPLTKALESPSRRNVVHLPDDDLSCSSSCLLDPPSQVLIEHGDELEWGRRLEEQQQIRPSRQTLFSPANDPLDDTPSRFLDSPFQIPLVVESAGLSFPPNHSLLFSPPEPEDVPLPESPESNLLYLTGSNDEAQPNFAAQSEEEARIRALHTQMVAAEARSRTREAILTEFITKLCLSIPSPPQSATSEASTSTAPALTPVPVHQPKRKDAIVVSTDGFYQYRENARREGDRDHTPPASSATVASDLPPHQRSLSAQELQHDCFSSAQDSETQAQSTLDLIQQRTRELHTAIGARANERRLRKRAKERARELEALLHLGAARVRAHSDQCQWESVAQQAASQRLEPVVLSASGSAFHVDPFAQPSSSLLVERKAYSGRKARGNKRAGIMQLVAKMILRRRDSQRPLNGKSVRPMSGRYVRSSLSREVLAVSGDEESEKKRDAEDNEARKVEDEDDFDILENGPQLGSDLGLGPFAST